MPWDEDTNTKQHDLGKETEQVIANYFRRHGAVVLLTSERYEKVDMIILNDGRITLCDVKRRNILSTDYTELFIRKRTVDGLLDLAHGNGVHARIVIVWNDVVGMFDPGKFDRVETSNGGSYNDTVVNYMYPISKIQILDQWKKVRNQ